MEEESRMAQGQCKAWDGHPGHCESKPPSSAQPLTGVSPVSLLFPLPTVAGKMNDHPPSLDRRVAQVLTKPTFTVIDGSESET